MTQTTYFVQSLKDGKIETLAHGKDEETGELYCAFLDKKKAEKLIEEEKKVSPEYKYRIVKETYKFESWE